MIYEEFPAVANSDIYVPEAMVAVPVEANLSLHRSISLIRMLAIHPARCMGSTMMLGYCCSRHSSPCCIREAVPLGNGREVVFVTFQHVSPVCTWGTVSIAEFAVAGTFSWIYKKERVRLKCPACINRKKYRVAWNVLRDFICGLVNLCVLHDSWSIFLRLCVKIIESEWRKCGKTDALQRRATYTLATRQSFWLIFENFFFARIVGGRYVNCQNANVEFDLWLALPFDLPFIVLEFWLISWNESHQKVDKKMSKSCKKLIKSFVEW